KRTDGASLMNLSRNIGGSVGISVVTALLARNVQISHEVLGGHLTTGVIGGADPVVSSAVGGTTDQALMLADVLVNQHAAMIAYIDDFKLMMILTLAALPLVFVLKRPRGAAPVAAADAMGH
ncbi:MAG TPA: EmrB/QacA family drug resistance transporter, partial [Sphingomicrobium sp.]